MSWRTIIVTGTAKLDYRQGFLIVRGNGTKKIHINEIETLMIESTAVSVTAYLLKELTSHKVKVIFCDEKRNPSSELIPYYGSHDTSIKIREQIIWEKHLKTSVWTDIIKEKIHQQAMVLRHFGLKEETNLLQYISEVEFGDTTNREGHAAKVYFNAMFGKQFSRKDDNVINAALNYGYSLILSAFNREIVANGFITQLGLSHSNRFNPFNFASDLMEPFRPLVDVMVKENEFKKFETDEKHEMVRLLEKEVMIKNRKEFLPNAIHIYCKSIFDLLCNKGEGAISFYSI